MRVSLILSYNIESVDCRYLRIYVLRLNLEISGGLSRMVRCCLVVRGGPTWCLRCVLIKSTCALFGQQQPSLLRSNYVCEND